jgi:hypothetical protein
MQRWSRANLDLEYHMEQIYFPKFGMSGQLLFQVGINLILFPKV